MEWNCGNSIAEIGGEKKNFPPISTMPLPQFHYTFFFLKKWYVNTIFTISLQQILTGGLLLLD